MMKTAQVAQKLKISPKTVLNIAKKMNISLEKNEHGHYLFTTEDVLRLSEYVPQVPNRVGVISFSKPQENTPTAKPNEEHLLHERLDKLEQSFRSFDYERIQYQLLQHRRELEELREENNALQAELDLLQQLISSSQQKKQTEEPRKRKTSFFASIFKSNANTV